MNIEGLTDYEARRAIREVLDANLVVEAAAGTGKTTELVQRIVRVLESGRGRVDSIVAVTFTEKAAGEMKLRLRGELERALVRRSGRGEAAVRARLEDGIVQLEAARIGTIHGFCHDLLRERPVEAGVDPGFEVLDEAAAKRLFARVFDDWFEATLEHPPEGLRRVLRRAAGRGTDLRIRLRRAAYERIQTRDFDAPWRREPFARAPAIDALVEAARQLGEGAERAYDTSDNLARSLDTLARFAQKVERREQVEARDYDALEAELAQLAGDRKLRYKGYGRMYGPELPRSDVLARRGAFFEQLDACVACCDADLAACLHAELGPLVDRYEQAKVALGGLDFFDLLLCTRDLLRDHGGVRAELRARFTHLFLDEFQDTDPVQTEIVLWLSGAPSEGDDPWATRPAAGKLFVVGDPKQSIYRFRRADQRFYERVKAHLVSCGARSLALSTSFRARPPIQSLVNASFEPVMQAGGGYVPLSAFRAPRADQPSVVALPVPAPYSQWGRVTGYAIEASLPEAVGAFIDWLLHESGWTVEEAGRQVPVAGRHVCLLFRRTAAYGRDVVHPYVRALEARHIHHARGGGRSFHEREEVLALRVALSAIEWPDDTLSVYATLRGPLFALTDDVLLRARSALTGLHPLKPVDRAGLDDELREVADALEVLGTLHASRNHRPVQHTLQQLLDATRAHAAIAIWPTGEQALGNVLYLCELARRYERTQHASSFRGFVDWLDEQAQQGESPEAAVVEEGDEGVRIMTVHGAKGLEFPVVLLCDPTAPRRAARPSRWVDESSRLWASPIMGLSPVELIERADQVLEQDEAEEIRLAYVAATRARELLVVPVVGDRGARGEDRPGWLDVLWPAVYPPHDRRREARPAMGCPRFGDDSVLVRPEKAAFGTAASVAPGAHRPERGEHEVVFWDPERLDLAARPIGGLRQQELLKDDGEGGVAGVRMRAYVQWRDAWKDTREKAVQPSVDAQPVTALAAQREGPQRQVHVERCVHASERPGGPRFGSLVHAVLQHAEPEDDAGALGALAEALGRANGASEAECAAAATAVQVAREHPLMRRAYAAVSRGELRREAAITFPRGDAGIAEGVVDLAFREEGAWWVVDYKTDTRAEESMAYRQQLSLYAEALEAITGETVHCVLFMV